jgi:hypothetical protein
VNGAAIDFDGTQYVIERKLRQFGADGQIHAYSIKNEPNKTLITTINKTALLIRYYREHSNAATRDHAVPLGNTLSNGLYSIIDNLTPLQGYRWMTSGTEIDPNDLPKMDALASFIKAYLKKEKTPKELSQISWFFTHDNQLASIDAIEEAEFDFNAFEDFIIEHSAGNDAVRKYLLKKSGLSDEVIADFYKKVVKSTLKGTEMNMIEQLAIHESSDKRVLERAQSLKEEMTRRMEERILELQTQQPGLESSKARKQARDELQKAYDESKTISNTRCLAIKNPNK